MRNQRFGEFHCSISRASDVAADPWTLLVLRDLFLGMSKFDEFQRDLGLATNVLADRLQHLLDEGLVVRQEYTRRPPRHEYLLTDDGRDLYGIVLTLMAWGDEHRATEGRPLILTHGACGHVTTPVVACSHCGEPLVPGAVNVSAGPGGRTAPGTALVADVLSAG